MEAFAQGITGAKAALYQILYLQTGNRSFPASGSRSLLPDGVQSRAVGQAVAYRGGTARWDRLREKSPASGRSGASSLHSLRDGGTLYISDWSGVHWVAENLEMGDVMETPEVGPSDLLLLCLNTIHATQTTDDRRLAVSLRTCDPETPIDIGWPVVPHLDDEKSRRPQQVEFPGFSTRPGTRLRHHSGGHRADRSLVSASSRESGKRLSARSCRSSAQAGALYLHARD